MDIVHTDSAETWETAKSKSSAVSWAVGSSVPRFRKPFCAIAKVNTDDAVAFATDTLATVVLKYILT